MLTLSIAYLLTKSESAPLDTHEMQHYMSRRNQQMTTPRLVSEANFAVDPNCSI